MAKVFVASSWQNDRQPVVVKALREAGHEVHDIRNPSEGGFDWSEFDPDWETWTPEQCRAYLIEHPEVGKGYMADWKALQWADTCVLVMPAGRSAHLQLGWMAGAGKRTIVLLSQGKPIFMHLLANEIHTELYEVVNALEE